MAKSLLSNGALVLGASASLFALIWLVGEDRRLLHVFGGRLFLLGIVVASGALMLLWSTIIGLLSRSRVWSPQWTYLAGAMPLLIVAIWTGFFSRLAMLRPGYFSMLIMVGFGSASEQLARKKVYPQFSDKDSPSASLPPPTLFPK
jgi:hypothetical protein